MKSKLLAKAIEDGYHGFMMQHKYPFTLLYLTMDGERVDVNVHPTKMELRFSNQEEIYSQLVCAIKDALMKRERIPEVTIERRNRRRKRRLLFRGIRFRSLLKPDGEVSQQQVLCRSIREITGKFLPYLWRRDVKITQRMERQRLKMNSEKQIWFGKTFLIKVPGRIAF